MAGLSSRKNGSRFVTFYRDGKRFVVHLGQMDKRRASLVAGHVDELVAAKLSESAVKPATAIWVKGIDDALAGKLAAAGLIEPRETKEIKAVKTLQAFIAAYIQGRTDLKPRSKNNLRQAGDWLVKYFGPERRIDTITAGDAIDDYGPWLKSQLGENTARIHCRRAKEFFRAAVRKRLIAVNPFAEMKGCYVRENRSRDYFVTREEAYAVIDHCPGTQWKLIFALARFGGLRCPSELVPLKWTDIDFQRKRMRVHSPKTEHHEGGEFRDIPIFDELLPYLLDAKAVAEPDAEYVVTLPRLRGRGGELYTGNIGPQMASFVRRSGRKPWPKLFQNLRASRAIEIAASHPLHVEAEWMGHDIKTAEKYYLRVTEADFEKASGDGCASPKAHPNAHPFEQPIETGKTTDWEALLQRCVENAIQNGNFGQLLATVGKTAKSQQLPPTGGEDSSKSQAKVSLNKGSASKCASISDAIIRIAAACGKLPPDFLNAVLALVEAMG